MAVVSGVGVGTEEARFGRREVSGGLRVLVYLCYQNLRDARTHTQRHALIPSDHSPRTPGQMGAHRLLPHSPAFFAFINEDTLPFTPAPSSFSVSLLLSLRHSPPLKLPAGRHAHGLRGGAAAAADGLHSLDHFIALQHLAEHDVLAVQPARGRCAQEELRAVRVGAGIGHRQRAWAEVLAGLAEKGLIGKLGAVDGLAASAVAVGEVTTLAHEIRDHTVERGVGVAEALLARAQRAEVLGRLGNGVLEELHRYAAGGLATDVDIHPNLGVGFNDRVVRRVRHYA